MSHLARFPDPADRTDPNEDLVDWDGESIPDSQWDAAVLQCSQCEAMFSWVDMDGLCDRCRLFAEYRALVRKE